MRFIALLMGLALLVPFGAQAYTYHVEFDDAIQDSIDAAKSGDTVLVHPGTYYESISLKTGVDVLSTDGPDSTTIDGENKTQTVLSSGVTNSTLRGFTITGGSDYGMKDVSGGSTLAIEHLVFNCDPELAVLRVDHSSSQLDSITIEGPASVPRGLWALQFSGDVRNVTIRRLQNTAISIESNYPAFGNVTIDSCGTGIYVLNSQPEFQDIAISNCTTGAEVHASTASQPELNLKRAQIVNCTTGISASATASRTTSVHLDSCTIENCTDGAILDKSSGYIKRCRFEDIDDTGISVEDCTDSLVIGKPDSANVFCDIGGVGIHFGSDAKGIIRGCTFDSVFGTAIEVETGRDSTFIVSCDMEGTGGCFEGIATSKSGTQAIIRKCSIEDYDDHLSPEPRGIIAYGPTADLGRSDPDPGDNSFEDNTIDLKYATRVETPDSLYAKNNWWGEDPPDTTEFAGRWKYIAYNPWLTSAPRLLPIGESLPEIARALVLTSVHPNPGVGVVGFSYWISTRGQIKVCVYDMQGRMVRSLVEGEAPEGAGRVRWDGCDGSGSQCASGVYLVRLSSNMGEDAGRFVLIK